MKKKLNFARWEERVKLLSVFVVVLMSGGKSFNKFKWRLRSWGKLFSVLKSLQNRSDGMALEWFGFGLFCSTAEKRMVRQRFAFDDAKCKYKITCQTLFNVIFTVNINFQKIRSWELSFLSSVNFLLLFLFPFSFCYYLHTLSEAT